MKYVLIVWWVSRALTATDFDSAFACAQAAQVMEAQQAHARCFPKDGDEGNYHHLFTEANPQVQE